MHNPALEALSRLFSTSDGLSLNEIERRLGVSTTTAHHRLRDWLAAGLVVRATLPPNPDAPRRGRPPATYWLAVEVKPAVPVSPALDTVIHQMITCRPDAAAIDENAE